MNEQDQGKRAVWMSVLIAGLCAGVVAAIVAVSLN
jgi:hypothetical protein